MSWLTDLFKSKKKETLPEEKSVIKTKIPEYKAPPMPGKPQPPKDRVNGSKPIPPQHQYTTTGQTVETRYVDSNTYSSYDAPKQSGDFLISMMIAQATDSPMMGAMIGGDMAGAMIGGMLSESNHHSNDYSSPSDFGGSSSSFDSSSSSSDSSSFSGGSDW